MVLARLIVGRLKAQRVDVASLGAMPISRCFCPEVSTASNFVIYNRIAT